MERVGLVGLVKLELPDGDVLLCDGGFIVWDGDTYKSADAVFGTVESIEALGEGIGNEVPALGMTLLPPGASEPGDLVQPGFQTCRARFWIAEFELETHEVDGTPDLLFDGQIDQTFLRAGLSRQLDVSVVSLSERLFERNTGNSLNPSWHKSVWPGELGHDNATGLSIPIAWGAEKPASAGGGGTYTPNPYSGSSLGAGHGFANWMQGAQ